MTIELLVDLEPLETPDFVFEKPPTNSKNGGSYQVRKHHVSELPDKTLEALCVRFRSDLLEKAGALWPIREPPND